MDQFTQFFADNIRFSTADFALLGLNMLGCAFVYYFMRLLRVPDHSWYLTLYSSGVTSFFGVYFFYHVCNDGFMATLTNEEDITRYIAIFFIGYCVMDLMLGEEREAPPAPAPAPTRPSHSHSHSHSIPAAAMYDIMNE